MKKKVSFGAKPTPPASAASPDRWVTDRLKAVEPIKRLTIDIPLSLHQMIKSQCALRGEKMADVVRLLLEKHFTEE